MAMTSSAATTSDYAVEGQNAEHQLALGVVVVLPGDVNHVLCAIEVAGRPFGSWLLQHIEHRRQDFVRSPEELRAILRNAR